jgi:hypothetical protein
MTASRQGKIAFNWKVALIPQLPTVNHLLIFG